MQYRTWLEIDTSALEHNIREAKKLIGNKVNLMAIVKSNAYGHGITEVAKIAQGAGASWLGVDSLEEAMGLKNAGLNLPILILGYVMEENLYKASLNGFSFVAYNKNTLEALGDFDVPVKIHLKIETGTMRQGVFIEDLPEILKIIKKQPNIKLEGIYTHFANIEDTTNHSFAMLQLDKFKKALKLVKAAGFKPLAHTACSAALILYPETHFDIVRLGLSMYGYWSSPQTIVSAKNLKKKIKLLPALSWKTRIAQIKKVKAGTPVGYGLTEKTEADTKLAIIPVGYWDGYDRRLSSIGRVLVGNKRCKIIGRVCMNMAIIDIGHVEGVKIEDEVVLIGQQGKEKILIEELAQKIGTINYEVITRINPLIPRIYK